MIRNRRHEHSGQHCFNVEQHDIRSIEDDFDTAPTSPLEKENEYDPFTNSRVITQQPLKGGSVANLSVSSNEENIPKKRKVIFSTTIENKQSITCCQNPFASNRNPNQIDMCPKTWFRNCCTWKDLLEDQNQQNNAIYDDLHTDNSKTHRLPETTANNHKELSKVSNENHQRLSKRTIANRICWRACFVSICLPTCYTCYICRTIRRSRRQGDVLKREQSMKRNENQLLLGSSANCMNRTLFTQVSEVKNRNKTASLENKNKTKNSKPEDNEAVRDDLIEKSEKILVEREDPEEGTTNTSNMPITNNTSGKNSKTNKLNVININVIVLKSKYSQTLHHYFSQKHESFPVR